MKSFSNQAGGSCIDVQFLVKWHLQDHTSACRLGPFISLHQVPKLALTFFTTVVLKSLMPALPLSVMF